MIEIWLTGSFGRDVFHLVWVGSRKSGDFPLVDDEKLTEKQNLAPFPDYRQASELSSRPFSL